MVNAVRVVVGVLGVALMVGGLIGITTGYWAESLWAIVAGGAVVLGVVLERSRYRSEAAERSDAAPGPGGAFVCSADAER